MNDLISRQAAIDTEGLDEEIRCEICRNPMHTSRGCDGNCTYDEKLYEKIMQILDRRIKRVPSAQAEYTKNEEKILVMMFTIVENILDLQDGYMNIDDMSFGHNELFNLSEKLGIDY